MTNYSSVRRKIRSAAIRSALIAGALAGSSALSSAAEVSFTTDRAWPPATFLNEKGEYEGYLYEIEVAIANKAGWDAKFESPNFETVIPGILSSKYDIGGNVDATDERLKIIDVVPVITIGYTLITRVDGGIDVGKDLADICGRTLAIIGGTVQFDALQDQSNACVGAGKAAITLQAYPDSPAAQLAVLSKHADATAITTSQSAYFVKNAPQWRETGPIFSKSLTGFAIRKNNPLTPKLVDTLNELIKDGTYRAILDKWGAGSTALDKTQVLSGK